MESLEGCEHSGTQGKIERLNSRVAALEQQVEQLQARARRQVSSQAVTGDANVQQDRPKAQRIATNPPRSSTYSKEPFLGLKKSEWAVLIKVILSILILLPLFSAVLFKMMIIHDVHVR